MTCEVPPLQHELENEKISKHTKTREAEKNVWYDAMEDAPRVPKSVLARRKLPEVPRRQWHYIVI
jgi:hypothetical protein